MQLNEIKKAIRTEVGKNNKKKYVSLDLYISLFVLLSFMLFFLVMGSHISSASNWQRYEIYILKTQDGICDYCWKDKYIEEIKDFFIETDPRANYSILFPVWLDKQARLFSFSILSDHKVKILEMYDNISKYEKCESKLMEVHIDDYKIQEFGRANRSKNKCKLFFMYERKL